MIKRLLELTFISLLYIISFIPACCIALLDHNNGQGFKHNLREILGLQPGRKTVKKEQSN